MSRFGLQVMVASPGPFPLTLSISCGSEQILALVGPSGSGKSTTLRMIAGLRPPKIGLIQCGRSVWFDSEQRVSLPTERRRVGYLPQGYGLFPHLSAIENVAIAIDGGSDADSVALASNWLKRLGILDLAQRLPRHLSFGQQQRVALARALARNPEVLLLDEPYSALDHATRTVLVDELRDIQAELRIPTIVVTHDVDDVLSIATHAAVLVNGHIQQSGAIEEVVSNPNSSVVARVMGHENLLDAWVMAEGRSAGYWWVAVDGMRVHAKGQKDLRIGERACLCVPRDAVTLTSSRPAEAIGVLSGSVARMIHRSGGESVVVAITGHGSDARLECSLRGRDDRLAVGDTVYAEVEEDRLWVTSSR